MLTNSIHRYRQWVNEQLQQALATLTLNDPQLKSAMNYGLLMGGKRVRPFLVYSVGEMLGLSPDTLHPSAAAIESIHAYSLIHDDLPAMDNDELRRGHPTLHIAFSEASAILAGDALQALAFEILSQESDHLTPLQQLKMIKSLSHAAGYSGMCGGQAMDLSATDKTINLKELKQLHRLKTGALIRCAVELPMIAADIAPEHRTQLLKFADAIGLAFQVQDDVIDITSSTEELGKPQGSDCDSNKSTYPKLLGLSGAQATATSLIQDALSALEKLPYNSDQLAQFAQYIIERKV